MSDKKEYIEREALMNFPIRIDHYDKEHGNEHFVLGIETVLEYAENLPAADVAAVRHGRWMETRRGQKSPEGHYYWNTPLTHVYVCSECGRKEDKQEPYCHCGAKMDEVCDNG